MEALGVKLTADLKSQQMGQESQSLIEKCISLFDSYRSGDFAGRSLAFLEALLITIIKPIFNQKNTAAAYASFGENSTKVWQTSASWSIDVLRWILDQYGSFEVPVQKRGIDSQFSLLVPPMLALMDIDDLMQRKIGFEFLRNLCDNIIRCESAVLTRTGFTKIFEDSLGHSMLLLPALTPEDESLEILGSLYPTYRALVQASSFSASRAVARPSAPLTEHEMPSDASSLGKSVRAMQDRMLRDGLLAGYVHASDHVRIATLLVTEMSRVIEMMGIFSAKYLSQLLPILHNILTNPFGTAHEPLLISAIAVMRQIILQCRPRVADVWFDECSRTMIGLWMLLSDETDDTSDDVKEKTKEVMKLLLQLKEPEAARKYKLCLEDQLPPGLFPAG
jgi:hypothetical protein